MNTIRFTSKQDFITALESRRSFWRAYDQRREAEHLAAEDAWLRKAQARLREALTWDYRTLQEHLEWGDLKLGRDTPSCPVLMEPKIDRVIAALAYTSSKVFTVTSGSGVWSEAHDLLTQDPDARKTVC